MYAAAAGMNAQQARLDALSSDIANVNTAGYKPTRQAFRDLLYSQAGTATINGVQVGAGSAVSDLGRNDAQGNIATSDDNLDVAIVGPGYLQVRSATGETLLTRNGRLQIDAQGRLAMQSGDLLQPTIQLPKGTQAEQVGIAANGTVTVAGKAIGQLRLLTVDAPSKLAPSGTDTFRANAESGTPRAAGSGTTLQQGAIETSGVQLSDAMTEMLQTQRAYQLASRAISTQDKIAEIADGVKR
ncbi:MAG: flagellar hook-basal body protein [Patulibacter sp.]